MKNLLKNVSGESEKVSISPKIIDGVSIAMKEPLTEKDIETIVKKGKSIRRFEQVEFYTGAADLLLETTSEVDKDVMKNWDVEKNGVKTKLVAAFENIIDARKYLYLLTALKNKFGTPIFRLTNRSNANAVLFQGSWGNVNVERTMGAMGDAVEDADTKSKEEARVAEEAKVIADAKEAEDKINEDARIKAADEAAAKIKEEEAKDKEAEEVKEDEKEDTKEDAEQLDALKTKLDMDSETGGADDNTGADDSKNESADEVKGDDKPVDEVKEEVKEEVPAVSDKVEKPAAAKKPAAKKPAAKKKK